MEKTFFLKTDLGENYVEIKVLDEEVFVLIRKHFQTGLLIQETMQELLKRRLENLDSETDTYGKALEPLAPYTIMQKGHDKILYDTGLLKKKLPDSIKKVSDLRSVFPWKPSKLIEHIIYALDPETSPSFGEGRPVRDFWSVTNDDEQIVDRNINRMIARFESVS